MKTLVVYRLEYAATGVGPFEGPGVYCTPLGGKMEAHCQANPLLAQLAPKDIRGFKKGQHFCAVEELTHLQEWFGPFREELLAEGYVVIKYLTAPNTVRRGTSRRQVGFLRAGAVSREQIDWPPFSPQLNLFQ